MRALFACIVALWTLISGVSVSAATAAVSEKRIALVIGNAGYQANALQTAANDAGLIAQTLQAAGFDVIGARDLDQESLRRAFREFLEKASSAGPDTVVFIYLSGYGLQLEGENYFVPIDAKIGRDADVPAEALRLSDYIRPLAALKLKASIVVLDAARRTPFAIAGEPLAGGLALVEPSQGMLMAFNAAPGTVAPEQAGPYGAYPQALAEMMREGGLTLTEVFERVRLRVNDMTKGAQVPWSLSRIEAAFAFLDRAPDAQVPDAAVTENSAVRSSSISDLPPRDAYLAAVERDTLEGYEQFIAAYPDDPMAKRVRAILAARREAITWQETYAADTPNAYWSYLRRYPHGLHCADARRRLALRALAFEPPATFTPMDYDVPPPPPEEEVYIDRPVLVFDDAEFGFAPLPSLPVYFLPPPPPEFVVLPAPLPVVEAFVLPVPVFVPIPVWCHLPAYVVPPPNNVIVNNIHNTFVIDHEHNSVTIRNERGEIASSPPGHFNTSGVHALAAALPASIVQRAIMHPPAATATSATPQPAASLAASKVRLGHPLPGTNGQPLPRPPGGSVGVSSEIAGFARPTPSAKVLERPHPQANTASPTTSAKPSSQGPLGHPLPGTNASALPALQNPVAVVPPAGPMHASTPTTRLPAGHSIAPPATVPRASSHATASPPAAVRPPTPSHVGPRSGPAVASRLQAPVRSYPSATAQSPRLPAAAQTYRAPPPPAAAYRSLSPLPAAYHPAPPPVPAYRPPAPPAAAYRPPPPAAAYRPAPPPVHAAPPAYRPPPAVHAAPSPPPAVRSPPVAAKRT
jgi:uncharacterized caspase-like protein